MATKRPRELQIHGHTRTDDYYWLRQRESREVLEYLEAENAHTEEVMAHTKPLQETLFEEIKGRIPQDDRSPPVRRRSYYYYHRQEEGQEYPIHCRKKGSLDAPEEIYLDVNELAEGHEFFNVRNPSVSSGEDILVYASDTRGRRIYTIRFKNLTTGEVLDDEIREVTANLVWAEDNRTLFYVKQDPQTLRSYRVYRHELGTDAHDDVLVYEEKDDTFSCYVTKTQSRRYIVILSAQTLSTECRIIDATQPQREPVLFEPRQRDHEYSIDHLGGRFYVRTNWKARNFRLMATEVSRTQRDAWEELVPHRDDVLLRRFELFDDHLVVEERQGGLVRIRVLDHEGAEDHALRFDESAYQAAISSNPEPSTHVLRFVYTSLTTPQTYYDYDMRSREKTIVKRQEVLGDFNPANYRTERLFAIASDGVSVPISLVYRKDLRRESGNPTLLYGYGSYGISIDATFRSSRLSLLDRGFVFAIAHIRGGQELGRAWYEDGKLLKKKNTFTDFIACGEHLIDAGYCREGELYAMGGSAGGLLIGAVINLRPDLFHGVISHVPFVDIVTTMLDETIPLTTSEYDEWGNPNDKTYYDYMLSYSPYDNIEEKDYPHILVQTGLHDSQVQYWEPAKWVAKLRSKKTDSNRLLLKTNMAAGHGGASGRYKQYREIAFDWAFLLDLAKSEDT